MLLVPHQILDYTNGRASTFFEGAEAEVTHIDFTEPYTESVITSYSIHYTKLYERFSMPASR